MSELQSERPDQNPIWPEAIITIGLSLTATWVILIGYGLIKLVEYAI